MNYCSKICRWTSTKFQDNKKVLLRERKRHTACRVVSTHSVVLSWLNPPPPGWLTHPPPGWLTPPQLTDPPWLTPPADWPPQLADPPPRHWLTPPGWVSWLTPPPPKVWTDKQSETVKLLPSRRTTYAGGKNISPIDETDVSSLGWWACFEPYFKPKRSFSVVNYYDYSVYLFRTPTVRVLMDLQFCLVYRL